MFFSLAAVEVGTQFEWNIAGFAVHGQVLLVTWLVIAITSHVTNNTCPCTVKPAMFQYKCSPTSTAANEKNIN